MIIVEVKVCGALELCCIIQIGVCVISPPLIDITFGTDKIIFINFVELVSTDGGIYLSLKFCGFVVQ